MTSQEYITQVLNEFIVQFPQTRVRYEYDQLSDVHFIEVVPNNVYHLDKHYITWETDLYDTFISLYPDQNICFVSDDAIVGLENIQLVLTGSNYDIFYSTSRAEIMVEESAIKISGFVSTGTFLCFTSNSNSMPETEINTSVVLQDNDNWSLAA